MPDRHRSEQDDLAAMGTVVSPRRGLRASTVVLASNSRASKLRARASELAISAGLPRPLRRFGPAGRQDDRVTPGVRQMLADIGSLQEVVEAADPVPAITVTLDHNPMLAVLTRTAVIGAEEIDQHDATFPLLARGKSN